MIIFYTLTLMTAKPHKPSLIYSPIYHLPNATYFRMSICVIRNMREKEFYQIHLRNTGLNKLKLISILQSLSYANVHTNLQDVIISVYQSYLTMNPLTQKSILEPVYHGIYFGLLTLPSPYATMTLRTLAKSLSLSPFLFPTSFPTLVILPML